MSSRCVPVGPIWFGTSLMTLPLADVCAASLPAAALPMLAPLRAEPGIVVALRGERAWVQWRQSDEQVLQRLLAVPGIQLFVSREGRWHTAGRHLPAFGYPSDLELLPLHQLLFPAPMMPEPPGPLSGTPALLRLAADDQPRPTTGLECSLEDLIRWSELATTARLASLRVACCDGRVLVLGQSLPPIVAGQRYWGEGILVPLGSRAEPDLPAETLRAAAGLGDDELLVLRPNGPEVVPLSAFQPLTRAQVQTARDAHRAGGPRL
jgi:hypothetical protein